MPDNSWNPWKLTAIIMAAVVATALVTGLVVANWTGGAADRKASEPERTAVDTQSSETKASRVPASPAPGPRPAPAQRVASTAPATPPPNAIEVCNQYAAQQVGQENKTTEVVKDGAVGALLGAAVGAAGGAVAGGGKGAGKGAAIGGVVGAGAGTLYGLNENKKNDERYREAYSACMRSRGYTS